MQLHEIPNLPKIYIGVDIHKRSWSISIQTDLFFHKSYSMQSSAIELYSYVDSHFKDHEIHLVYEAGCCGFHITNKVGGAFIDVSTSPSRQLILLLYTITDAGRSRLKSDTTHRSLR